MKKNFCLLTLLGLACALLSGFPLERCGASQRPAPDAIPGAAERTAVFVGRGLSDEEVINFSSAVAGAPDQYLALLESKEIEGEIKRFFDTYPPRRIVQVNPAAAPNGQAIRRDEGNTIEHLDWQRPFPKHFWHVIHLHWQRVVVCQAEPRRLLLQAACLAGVLQAPLCVLHGRADEEVTLRRMLAARGPAQVFVVGGVEKECCTLPGTRVITLPDEESVVARYLRYQLKKGPVTTLVLANPADCDSAKCAMSSLAPWLAVQKRALLALTNESGNNVRELVERALKQKNLQSIDSVIFLADLHAIPSEHRPNPAPGKDVNIEMEPLTPRDGEPFTFATGRLFHKSPSLIPLLLARQQLLAARSANGAHRKALVISNPAGGLPLLETFSRNTASELRNAGYDTTAIYGNDVTANVVRKLLPEQDIFLWEGHHSTMTRNYGLPNWPESLRPSLVFLQSCLALSEEDALPLLARGAIAVVGSSSRTYSASGGACSLAFFDALLYDNQSLGASLRHAKNFLLAYALLKEKRLGDDARLSGANIRSAWAFSLWGDPTLQMPRPQERAETLLSVQHEVRGNVIELHQPGQSYGTVISEHFQADMLPNARLAGLVTKKQDSGQRQLVPFLFAEVRFPKAPPGKRPGLQSRIPEDHWVFTWDARRHCGYLLVTPRAKDTGDLRFQVHWLAGDTTATDY